jgi:hypothetical protein
MYNLYVWARFYVSLLYEKLCAVDDACSVFDKRQEITQLKKLRSVIRLYQWSHTLPFRWSRFLLNVNGHVICPAAAGTHPAGREELRLR